MFKTHSRFIVPSLPDPKANILVDNSGHACLAGFNPLSGALGHSTATSPVMGGGTIRWMAPELFDPAKFGLDDDRPTKHSDCYALGMVVYEILSGEIPFASYSSHHVISKVLGGEHPGRPQWEEGSLFTDRIWETLELCWKPQPGDRPSARVVLLGLVEDPPPLGSSCDVG